MLGYSNLNGFEDNDQKDRHSSNRWQHTPKSSHSEPSRGDLDVRYEVESVTKGTRGTSTRKIERSSSIQSSPSSSRKRQFPITEFTTSPGKEPHCRGVGDRQNLVILRDFNDETLAPLLDPFFNRRSIPPPPSNNMNSPRKRTFEHSAGTVQNPIRLSLSPGRPETTTSTAPAKATSPIRNVLRKSRTPTSRSSSSRKRRSTNYWSGKCAQCNISFSLHSKIAATHSNPSGDGLLCFDCLPLDYSPGNQSSDSSSEDEVTSAVRKTTSLRVGKSDSTDLHQSAYMAEGGGSEKRNAVAAGIKLENKNPHDTKSTANDSDTPTKKATVISPRKPPISALTPRQSPIPLAPFTVPPLPASLQNIPVVKKKDWVAIDSQLQQAVEKELHPDQQSRLEATKSTPAFSPSNKSSSTFNTPPPKMLPGKMLSTTTYCNVCSTSFGSTEEDHRRTCHQGSILVEHGDSPSNILEHNPKLLKRTISMVSPAKNHNPEEWPLPQTSSPRHKRLKREIIPKPGHCYVHDDPDCEDPNCSSEFFEQYDPFEEVIEEQSEEHYGRASPGFDQARVLPERPQSPQTLNPKSALSQSFLFISEGYQQRRPYFSEQDRDWLNSCVAGYDKGVVHIPFTYSEAITVYRGLSHSKEVDGIVSDKQIGYLAKSVQDWQFHIPQLLPGLPGRSEKDIDTFIKDCIEACNKDISKPFGGSYMKFKPKSNPKKSKSLLLLRRECGQSLFGNGSPREVTRRIELQIRDNLPPWMVFTDGSSDILDIAWSPDGQKFALSCCTFNDMYNRPGNLMHGSLDTLKIRMLGEHRVPRPRASTQAVLDPYLYSTVPSVKFSRGGNLMFSGSYDNTIKVWRGLDGVFLDSIDLGSGVQTIATSPIYHNLLASGCKNGKVAVLSLDEDGIIMDKPLLFRPQRESIETTFVAFCNGYKPNWLIAGYDTTREDRKTGDLSIFDIKAQKLVSKPVHGNHRQFDMFFDERTSLFATASIAGKSNGAGRNMNTCIRIYNIDGDVSNKLGMLLDFDSPQVDINRVTMSPCSNFVTASGTDGSTHVFDRRNPGKILHVLQHGPSTQPLDGDNAPEDTGCTFATWGPSNDRIYTGSSDGVVKIWDVKRGDPFVRDFAELSSQVISGSFSPDYSMLMIGECSGKATLYSTLGDNGTRPARFIVDRKDITNNERIGRNQQMDSGIVESRRLLEQGKMVLRNGCAWAV